MLASGDPESTGLLESGLIAIHELVSRLFKFGLHIAEGIEPSHG